MIVDVLSANRKLSLLTSTPQSGALSSLKVRRERALLAVYASGPWAADRIVRRRQLATIDRYRDAQKLEQLLRRVSQSASEHFEVLTMLPIGNVRKEARDLEFLDRY
jgi:hypothetical protein